MAARACPSAAAPVACPALCVALLFQSVPTVGVCVLSAPGASTEGVPDVLEVEVIDNAEDYVKQIQAIFDVPRLRALLGRPDFKFVYDGMHGGASDCSSLVPSH
jgi:hypothetical protein